MPVRNGRVNSTCGVIDDFGSQGANRNARDRNYVELTSSFALTSNSLDSDPGDTAFGGSVVSMHPNPIKSFRARGLDLIPFWKMAWRKWITFQTISRKQIDGPASQETYLDRWSAIQSAAQKSRDLHFMTASFWKMESLGADYCRQPPGGNTLCDPRLPLEVRPIAHTGLGVAAVEVGEFDPARITRTIDSLANPNFRLFAYESLGAVLGVYQMPVPKNLLGLKRLRRPEPERFINFFPAEIQRLISNGYGRILYFNSLDLVSAVRSIARRRFLQAPAAIQGMAFAYAMVNSSDLWVVLETGCGFEDSELRTAFQNGLIYALEFWEWAWPGWLRSLNPPSARSAALIAIAQQEIDSGLARGELGAFVVGNHG